MPNGPLSQRCSLFFFFCFFFFIFYLSLYIYAFKHYHLFLTFSYTLYQAQITRGSSPTSRACKSDGSGVSSLKKDGLNYSDPADQVEILNQQFVNSFTREDCTSFPQMGPGLQKTAAPITIQENGVKKLFEGLNPHKAGGPDHISPRFLKEMAPFIAPSLTSHFKLLMTKVKFQMIGREPMSPNYTRKEIEATTDQYP